jgi:hypothetical protein
MSKREENTSLFGLQNLLLLSDFLDDEKKFRDKKELKEKTIANTLDSMEKKELKGSKPTVVAIGFAK